MTSEAAQVLIQLPPSGPNFRIGLKKQENRYANKRLIIHANLQGILILPKLHNESAEHLRKLLIAFDEILMTSAAFEIETEPSDSV